MNGRNNSRQHGFKARATGYLIAGFIAIQAMAISQPAEGTWNKLIRFPASDGPVLASFFFNAQVGLIGFHWNNVSTAGCVKRTIDGGLTWTDCTVPALISAAPQITDIWFSDSLNGWLTLHISDPTSGDPTLWRSIDGGKTWNAVSSYYGIWACSVRLSQTTLVVTDCQGLGLQWSTDSGKTWPNSKNVFKAGLDFEDGLHGVASVITGPDLYTTDGGLNWNQSVSPYSLHAWDVYAVKHGGVFVAVPNDTQYNHVWQDSKVYRSVNYDNGRDFTTNLTLPFRANGAVRGVEGIIYVQNSNDVTAGVQGPAGLLRSDDSGQTWKTAFGPNEGDDIRFAVTGCGNVVYAFDDSGGVYKTIDAGNGDIPGQCEFVDNDTLAPLKTTVCDTLKNIFYLHNINISTIVLDDLSIFDSARRPAKTTAVYFDSLPDAYSSIIPGDSLAFGLAWHPGALEDSTGSDSVTIRVIYYASYLAQFPGSGLIPYDTLYLRVKLSGESTLPDYSLSVTKNMIKTDTLITCNSVDTILTIINNGCDSLLIKSASLLKNTWSFTTGSAIAPITLPYYLQSKDSIQVRLHATPVSEAILFDSLRVNMHYMGNDSSFGVGLRTNAKVGSSLSTPLALQFDSVATCVSSSQILSLPNLGCDTVTITQSSLSDTHFELLDTNDVPLKLPLKIPADSIAKVIVRFTPATLGGKAGNLSLHYLYYGVDSILSIAVSGIGSAFGSPDFPTTFNFHNVSICSGGFDTTITISNKTCLKIYVDSLIMTGPFVLLDSTKIPVAVDTGTSLTLRIRYKPDSKQTENGLVYLKLQIDDGVTTQWDTLSFTGTGVSGISAFQANLPGSSSTLDFGTISECGSTDSISFKVYNPGCDTTVVTGVSLDAGLNATFTADANQAFPANLGAGDTVLVTVVVLDLIANTYSGNLHIAYTLSDGTTGDLPIPISLIVAKGGSGPSILNNLTPAAFNFNSFNACYTTPDTAIIVKYSGCGIDTVKFSLAGTGFVFAGGLDSTIYLNPGETAKLLAYYDGSTRGSFASTVTISSKAATDSTFSVQFTGNVQPPSSVNFNVTFSKMPVNPGEFFSVYLTPDKLVSGQGLHEIHGELICPLNSFEYLGNASTELAGPAKLGPISQSTVGSMAHYQFDITDANDISLDQATHVLIFPLEAVLSDTNGGMIFIDSLGLNGGDSLYGACTLSANSNTSLNTMVATNQCGDSTLILSMENKPLFSVAGLSPNPVTQESGYKTTLGLVSAEDGTAEIVLYDALGQVASRGEISLTHDQAQNYTFDMHDLSSGSYYFSLLFNGQTAAGNLRGTLLLVK